LASGPAGALLVGMEPRSFVHAHPKVELAEH